MAQWGKTDTTGDSVLWGVSQLEQTANTVNRDALYNNTTPDVYFTGATHSQKAFDTTEATATGAGVAHSGWVLETIGSGGRAGRVQREVLVAMGSITGDATAGDTALVFSLEPSDITINNNAPATYNLFTVTFDSVPTGETLTYTWEYSSDNLTWLPVALNTPGGIGYDYVAFEDVVGATGPRTITLQLTTTGPGTAPTGNYFRIVIDAGANAVATPSRSALLTVTNNP